MFTIEYIKTHRDETRKYLVKQKENYYNNIPEISDAEFDEIEDNFREYFPNDVYFSSVGISAKGINLLKHDIPMLSCAKAKTIDDVDTWLKKINQPYDLIAMPKVDGISCSIQYNNGKLVSMSTRGDGNVGTDITWLKDYINVPLQITLIDCEVRGEIYLPKKTKFPTNGKPFRALAGGLLNRKENKKDCQYLKFIAYWLHSDASSNLFDGSLRLLSSLGFDTVDYALLLSKEDVEAYKDKYLLTLRDEFKFETDGLVLQLRNTEEYDMVDSQYKIDHHHHYNIALKPPCEGVHTVLRSVIWETSRNGNIIPVANFDTIYLGGKDLSNATLNNYDNVKKLNLKIGDEIFIEYANEVIPFFKCKTKDNSGESCLITNCPSCGTRLYRNGVHIQCCNDACPDKMVKKLTHWCTVAGMDNISESTIRKLYESKLVYDYIDLYNLHDVYDTLIQIDGFGTKKVDNLLAQIEKSRNCTFENFMCRFGIELVGEKALNKLGIDSYEALINFNNAEYVIGQNVIEFVKCNFKEIKDLADRMNFQQTVKEEFKGKVCMTGKGSASRELLEVCILQKGYQPVDSVSKDTSILVCDNVNGSSSKLVKARKLGVTIMAYEEFFK